MKMRFLKSVNLILLGMLLASLFLIGLTSSIGEYNPWADINNDGEVNILDAILLANAFGASGEPPTKATIEYDSDWIDIIDKCGQYFDVVHNFNSTEIMVDIAGKTAVDGGVHQRSLGGTGFIPGWTQTYGGTDTEYAYSVIQTIDGGYAMVGYTGSFGAGGYDFWLVKTDAFGNHLWNQTYGGLGDDEAHSITQTNDGGYVLAGETDSFGAGNKDFWLIKIDALGNHVWNKTYGGTDVDYQVRSVIQTSDGGYAIIGNTRSFGAGGYDFWLVKTDAFGNHLWNQTYGGTGQDYGRFVTKTVDGGYLLTGYTSSFGAGSYDLWLVKTDKAGNHVWNKTYGGAESDYGGGGGVVQLVDGYVVAGWTRSFGAGDFDFWLVKVDRFGDHVWSQTYGGAESDGANSLVQTSDGGYILAGHTFSFGAGDYDFWLVKTDAFGNHLWNQTYGGTNMEDLRSVVQTVDGGYVIAGQTYSFGAGNGDLWLVRINMESGLAWTDSTLDTITLYRGATDSYWNYVRVRIWKIKENP